MQTKHVMLGFVSILLITATAGAVETFPAWSGGMPDPMTDNTNWVLAGGALTYQPNGSLAHHFFDIPIHTKFNDVTSQDLTIHWTHNNAFGCSGFCLTGGTMTVTAIALNAGGLVVGSIAKSDTGDQLAPLTIPAGGSAMLQVMFRGDADGGNSHALTRVWTTGTAAL